MNQSLVLESFDTVLSEPEGPSDDFNLGYAEGLAAGQQMALAEAAALEQALVQAIADIEFTYAEARGAVLESLRDLFAALADRLLPHCAAEGFANHIADALQEAAEMDTASGVVLHVHPQQKQAVEHALRNLTRQIDVRVDPALSLNAAWIQQGGSETHLDLDALTRDITQTLGALHPTEQRIKAHG